MGTRTEPRWGGLGQAWARLTQFPQPVADLVSGELSDFLFEECRDLQRHLTHAVHEIAFHRVFASVTEEGPGRRADVAIAIHALTEF